jgi:hypothetical protein
VIEPIHTCGKREEACLFCGGLGGGGGHGEDLVNREQIKVHV